MNHCLYPVIILQLKGVDLSFSKYYLSYTDVIIIRMLQFNVLFVWREKYEMGIIKNFCQGIWLCTHDSKCLYTICLPHDYSIVKIGHFWPRWYCFKGWSRKLRNCISVRSTITHKRVTSFHEIIKYFICGRCIKGWFWR